VLTNSCRAPSKNAGTPKIGGKCVLNVYCHIKCELQELYELPHAKYYKYLLQTLPSVNYKRITWKSKLLCHILFFEQFSGLLRSFECFRMPTKKSEVGGVDEHSIGN